MKPNVIVFLTDEQRFDTVGKYGNPLGLTPNLDALAEEGTLCRQAFTCQPVCCAARACIQSGLYANQNGCYKNNIGFTERDNRSLAHYFNEAGYRTGYIGKWHLAREGVVHEPERAGYQYWLGANAVEFCSDAYDLVLYDNDNEPVKIPGYRVDGIVDRAIRFIDENQNEPFFLFVSPSEPHPENYNFRYAAPRNTEQQYQGKWMPPDLASLGGTAPQHMPGYLAMVKRIDEAFGRLLDALISLDLYDNTIILFTSDHGEHFMTRNDTNKMSPHESSVRIPMVLHGPGFSDGRVINELVSLIDILPTLLEATGQEIPENLPGHSLLPLLNKTAAEWPEEVLIQTSETRLCRAIRTKKWKYAVSALDKNPYTDRCSDTYTETELYDLENDPYELLNLVGYDSYIPIKEELRERLLRKIEESGEERPRILEAEYLRLPDGILPQMCCPGEKVKDIRNPQRYWRW